MVSFAEKLSNVVNRFEELQALISSPDINAEDLVKMNKELLVDISFSRFRLKRQKGGVYHDI